jgi:hypothetical protein
MKTLIFLVSIISFLVSCKSVQEGKILTHAPNEAVSLILANTTITVDFSLDEGMSGVISSEIGQNKILNIKTLEELLNYYKSLTASFQPGYSSLSNDNEYVFSKIEYILAQECFQNTCDSYTRKNVLKAVVNKQKSKFGVANVTPSYTRRTGAFLIAVILLMEADDSFIQSIINNDDMKKALLCMNNNIWMEEESFNNILIQYAESFLAKE